MFGIPVPDRDLAAFDHLLQATVGETPGGDVFVKAHGFARGGGAFADPDQPTVGQHVLIVADLGQRTVERALVAVTNPLLDVYKGRRRGGWHPSPGG